MPSFTARGDASALLRGGRAEEDAAQPPPRPLFASLGLHLGGGAAAAAAVVEPRTGVAFPGEFCLAPADRGCPRIAGAGVRTKRLAGIKAVDLYAVALFVDAAGARALLAPRFERAPASDQALCDALTADEGVERTLVLHLTSRLVNRANFLAALDARLAPALGPRDAALAAFRAQFEAAPRLGPGVRVAFHMRRGRLVTTVDGARLGDIASAPLVRALQDAYFGVDPVSPTAKAAVARGLAALAAGEA